MEKIRTFIMGNKENIERKSFFWNMFGSMMMSLSTFVLTFCVTRIAGTDVNGVFTIAYTISQSLAVVAAFEMRAFQVTDVRNTFSASDYVCSRIITSGVTVIISVIYILFSRYSVEKSAIVFLMCTLKIIEAVCDVFEGIFQQNDRLDVAGKSLAFRTIAQTAVFILVLAVTVNLVLSIIAAIITSILFFLIFNVLIISEFEQIKIKFNFKALKKLFIACFPLFAGSFMLIYIYNAPKYAIDSLMESRFQSYYAYIFMPTFVINMFSGFLLKPKLTALANHWQYGELTEFRAVIVKMVLAVLGLTVVVTVPGYFVGLPILSWFYGVNLSEYGVHLVILLIGGGFSALSIVFYYALTVMRCQKTILGIYSVIFTISLLSSRHFVQAWGIFGASILYLGLMILMSVGFAGMFLKRYKMGKCEDKTSCTKT